MRDLTSVWIRTVRETLEHGSVVSPRGQDTYETLNRVTQVDLRYPVLVLPARKLHYQFMAAEAYWILSGDNRVETIAPFNRNISKFSDNGETFYGAYGPRIESQFAYVVEALVKDEDTRQAGLTIWIENPKPTKDVPCTISVFFNIRNGVLNIHPSMRSSDIWLGLPYDVFNFSMLAYMVCASLRDAGLDVTPGTLFLTAISSHIYFRNAETANKITKPHRPQNPGNPAPIDEILQRGVLDMLDELRYSKPGDACRWWKS